MWIVYCTRCPQGNPAEYFSRFFLESQALRAMSIWAAGADVSTWRITRTVLYAEFDDGGDWAFILRPL